MKINRKYSWLPDVPDHRDYLFKTKKIILPKIFSWKWALPEVWDQGELGSCTGNATAGLVSFIWEKGVMKGQTPSRLMIYYGARKLEGTIDSDSGAMIRDAIKSVNTWGVCSEKVWKYDINKFADSPSDTAYNYGKIFISNRRIRYLRVGSDLNSMKQALLVAPFVCGISVYESFESDYTAKTGLVSMPGPDEALLGGHAICVVGYDDETNKFIVRNSWGSNWGDFGYAYLPYSYLTNANLTDDRWIIIDSNIR